MPGDGFIFSKGFKYGASETRITFVRAFNWQEVYASGGHVSLSDYGVRTITKGPFLGTSGTVLVESDTQAKVLIGLGNTNLVFTYQGKTQAEKTTILNGQFTDKGPLNVPDPSGGGLIPTIAVNFQSGVTLAQQTAGTAEATCIVHAADSSTT